MQQRRCAAPPADRCRPMRACNFASAGFTFARIRFKKVEHVVVSVSGERSVEALEC